MAEICKQAAAKGQEQGQAPGVAEGDDEDALGARKSQALERCL